MENRTDRRNRKTIHCPRVWAILVTLVTRSGSSLKRTAKDNVRVQNVNGDECSSEGWSNPETAWSRCKALTQGHGKLQEDC